MTIQDYTDFRYIHPPRPELKIRPESLPKFEGEFWAQPKYNGSCAVLFLSPDGRYFLYNRHKEKLTLCKEIPYQYLNATGKWMVLAGEYLNKNKKGENGQYFNHKFVIWDILVYNDKLLLGSTFEERYNLLIGMFGENRSAVLNNSFHLYDHLLMTPVENVYLAPVYTEKFQDYFKHIASTDLYEGIVLKRRDGKLEPGNTETNNSSWQVKCRKTNNSYDF